jgi:addiction module RelE/StbE family toxin
MLTLKWSIKALIDLDQAQRYIAYENPTAARLVAQRIHDAAHRLLTHPSMGKPAHVPNARIWGVDRTPYLIVYRVRGERLEIVRLWHSRRDWQNAKS